MNQVKIGQFIQMLRKEKKLTQKQVADCLGVSDKTVSKWETGNGMPDLCFLKPLSDFLGITVNELLLGERLKEEVIIDVEKGIERTIAYSEEKKKNDRFYLYLIVIGLVTLAFTLLCLRSTSLVFWSTIVSLLLITIAIYHFKIRYKVLSCITFLLLSISALLIWDYYSVLKHHDPIYSFSIISNDSTMTYKSLFYNVYKCNVDTKHEYYEIDFSKKKNACMNPYDPNKSDMSRLIKYQNKYIGNNSNTSNLFTQLPLAEYGFTTEIDSNHLGIKLNYQHSVIYIQEDKENFYLKQSLIYNSISAFLLLQNLNYINFNFLDEQYDVTKEKVSALDFYDNLINDDKISLENVQKHLVEQLNDELFVNNIFNLLF